MNVSNEFKQKVWYVALFSIIALAILASFVYATTYVLVIFIGILFAVVIAAFIDWITNRLAVPRGVVFALTWLVLGAFLVGLVAILFPVVEEQSTQIWNAFEKVESVPLLGSFRDIFESGAIAGRIGGAVLGVANAFFSVVIILFVAIYGSLNPGIYVRGFVSLFPSTRQEKVRAILGEIGKVVRWWMVGRLGSSVVVGALTYVGLLIFGVDLAILLAFIAGILSFVPNIGPILSAVPAVLVAFGQDATLALYVVGLYVLVQVAESYFITPFIQRWAVHIPFATLFVLQVVLGVLFGIVGVLVAAPLFAIMVVLFTSLREEGRDA